MAKKRSTNLSIFSILSEFKLLDQRHGNTGLKLSGNIIVPSYLVNIDVYPVLLISIRIDMHFTWNQLANALRFWFTTWYESVVYSKLSLSFTYSDTFVYVIRNWMLFHLPFFLNLSSQSSQILP